MAPEAAAIRAAPQPLSVSLRLGCRDSGRYCAQRGSGLSVRSRRRRRQKEVGTQIQFIEKADQHFNDRQYGNRQHEAE
jgi:hypothetical protein